MFSTYIAPVEIAIIVHWTLTWWAGENTNATNSRWLSMNCNKSCALNPIQNYISSRSFTELTRGQIYRTVNYLYWSCANRGFSFWSRCSYKVAISAFTGQNIRFSNNFHIKIVNRVGQMCLRSIASATVLKSLTRCVNHNVQQCTRIIFFWPNQLTSTFSSCKGVEALISIRRDARMRGVTVATLPCILCKLNKQDGVYSLWTMIWAFVSPSPNSISLVLTMTAVWIYQNGCE